MDGFTATGNYFSVLGYGRSLASFVPDDDRPGAPAVAVISARYWHSRFGGDPDVIGKVIHAGGTPMTIVGVTPPDFLGVQHTLATPSDVSFPLALDARLKDSTGGAGGSSLDSPNVDWLEVAGRLRPGLTRERLEAMLDGPFQAATRAVLDAQHRSQPESQRAQSRRGRAVPRLLGQPGSRGVYDPDGNAVTTAMILSVIVAFVLMIVCANVANLMLSRAIVRQREMSIRLSLGATRVRLVRQVLTEGLLFAAAGGALGLVVTGWGVRLLAAWVGQPMHVNVFSWSTVGFTSLTSLATCALFAAAPAFRATRLDVNSTLKDASRAIAARGSLVARTLLVIQVTLSLVLLIGAGLFLRTVVNLQRVDVGFIDDTTCCSSGSCRRPAATISRARRSLHRAHRTAVEAAGHARGASLSQPAPLPAASARRASS